MGMVRREAVLHRAWLAGLGVVEVESRRLSVLVRMNLTSFDSLLPCHQDMDQFASGSGSQPTTTPAAVFSSLLKHIPADEAREHYTSRVQDKRLQLSNPDRPRPKPDQGSLAEEKLRRRQKRAALNSDLSKAASSSNGKGRASDGPRQLSRSQRKRRGMEGLDEHTRWVRRGRKLIEIQRLTNDPSISSSPSPLVSYRALLPLTQLWTSYVHQFFSLVKPDPASPTKLVPNPQNLRLVNSADGSSSSRWMLPEQTLTNIQSLAPKLDLVGARIRVTRSGNPSLGGVAGIVAKETESVVVIAQETSKPSSTSKTETDEGLAKPVKRKRREKLFQVVPKHNITFAVLVPLPTPLAAPTNYEQQILEIPMQGNQMRSVMVTRGTKKWKQKATMDY
jgi:hypothetical protein